jgi:hypothetical protein
MKHRLKFHVELEFDLANPSFPPKVVGFYPLTPTKPMKKKNLTPMKKTKISKMREL